jgi:hypothetical protein
MWLKRGGLTSRTGRRPWILVRRPQILVQQLLSASNFPYAAWVVGGWIVRRRGLNASGSMLGWRSWKVVSAICWTSGWRPRTLSMLMACQRVGYFIYVWASGVCSSHSSHDIFSSAVMNDCMVLRSGVLGLWMVVPICMSGVCIAPYCVGLVVWFSSHFLLINWISSS